MGAEATLSHPSARVPPLWEPRKSQAPAELEEEEVRELIHSSDVI